MTQATIGTRVEFGGGERRITANFIPADEITTEQLRAHLMDAHGFAGYEEQDGEPYHLRLEPDRKWLEVYHDEDHAENPGGGGNFCQHVHGKVQV